MPTQFPATWVPLQFDGTPSSKKNFVNLGTGAIQSVATGASRLFGFYAINTQASTAAYVQIFDLLVANITIGTTVPDEQLYVAGTSSAYLWLPEAGLYFANGISIQSTTAAGGASGSASGVTVYAMYLNP